MFWKYNTNYSSQIEALFAKEDVTLQEVMDTDEIINECRVQNKQLIDFLLKPEVMEELVILITTEPAADLDERVRFKYSNIACELLTCDVPALNERLASDETLLDKLYHFLDNDPPLNPLLASFFSKIMGALIAKKTEQVLDFLKAKANFIPLLLKHLSVSAVMDLLLKLFTQVEGVETKQNILNWLDSQQVIQSLIGLFDPKVDKDKHFNVAQLLCDFIRIARDNQRNSSERSDPDPLLNCLESTDTINLLLEQILVEEKSESAIVGGIQVLLALLDVHQISVPNYCAVNAYNANPNDTTNDAEQKQRVLDNIMQALLGRIGDFHNLLLNPPKRDSMETTIGLLDPPLGNTCLQVLRLYASILSTKQPALMEKIISQGTFPVLLELFFKYPWNNFLHTQVERCLVTALKTYVSEEGDDTTVALCKHLIENTNLIVRILDAWKENDDQQKEINGVRKGYMGHLTNIANKIVEMCSSTYLGSYLKENYPEISSSLDNFKNGKLGEINKIHDSPLGGIHPNSSNNNESDDYSEIPFPQSNALQQQMFAQYQMQHLSSQFIDGYSGFNDDAFNDGDDTLQSIDHRTDMNFDLPEGDLAQQQEIFKQVCAKTMNTLDDSDDGIFEDKDQTLQTVIEKEAGDVGQTNYSSDSDDDTSPLSEDTNMDVDPWNSPKNLEGSGDKLPSSVDPWSDVANQSEETLSGWADFNSANFDANFKSPNAEKSITFEHVLRQDDEKNIKLDSLEKEKSDEVKLTDSVENIAESVKDTDVEMVKDEFPPPEGTSIQTKHETSPRAIGEDKEPITKVIREEIPKLEIPEDDDDDTEEVKMNPSSLSKEPSKSPSAFIKKSENPTTEEQSEMDDKVEEKKEKEEKGSESSKAPSV